MMNATRTVFQSALAQYLNLTPEAINAAIADLNPFPRARHALGHYRETDTRANMRAILDAAANTGAVVRVGFLKTGGELRYMLAKPLKDVDGTNQYYTVVDLELSEAAGNEVYRRVNLDAVAGAQVEYRKGAL